MKCHVPAANVKVLGRTVHALARFGDELLLESLPDCVLLRTLNAAESAYAMVKFNKNFFSYFNYNYYSTDDGLSGKISMKSALNIFKSPAHMDKQVENLEIKLDPESCKLIFQLKCKHGIVKTHFVSILDCEDMKTVNTEDVVPNRITSPQRILSEAISNFQSSDDLVTIQATTQSLILRNYVDVHSDVTRVIRTQVCLKPVEFDSYTIGTETTITFTLKEFRAVLSFAEALSLPVLLNFEGIRKQVVFIVHNGSTFEAHFVLATSKTNDATQTTATQNTYIAKAADRSKRKDSTTQSTIRKKPHLDVDSMSLDEDSHLFNFIDIPGENMPVQNNNNEHSEKRLNGNMAEVMDSDNIPGSPTSKIVVKSSFKRCFESTFDPSSNKCSILAENSDSD